MSTPCSCVAGLRIALEMERRGRSLYLRAAQFAREESLRALLLELADEELEHHTVFSAMLEALGAPPLSPEENALAAARALIHNTTLSAEEIAVKSLEVAASICVFTNDHISVETL